MIRRFLFSAALMLVAPLAHAATNTCNWSQKGTTQACTMSYTDGNGPETRTLRLRLPQSLGAHPPVVIYLHGAPGGEYECDNTGWPAECDTEGCVLVCPRGGLTVTGGYSWNSLYPSTTPDDVMFVQQIISTVLASAGADATRVFVTGFSAGGWMTHRVGAELSDQIAAIATIASSLYIRNANTGPLQLPTAAQPVAVLHMQGTADGSIFYCGETSSVVTVGSQDETFDYWAKADGCTSVPSSLLCTTNHGSTVPGGTISAITTKLASGCGQNTSVLFYQLLGGDHHYYTGDIATPPGNTTAPYNPDVPPGSTGADIVWGFFAAHPKTASPPLEDAGVDAGIPPTTTDAGGMRADASLDGADASDASTPDASCACSTTGRPSARPWWLAIAVLVRWRRRSRSRS